MALRKCHNCNKLVDGDSPTCPNCGHHQKSTKVFLYVLLAFLVLTAFFVFLANYRSGPTAPRALIQTIAPTATPQIAAPAAISETTVPQTPTAIPTPRPSPTVTPVGLQWQYSSSEDAMGKGTTYFASVESSNLLEFSFPYQGLQRGRLLVRSHPRYGKDIIVSIEKGQIQCRSYKQCSVLVRFDDEAPMKFPGIGPDDNDTTAVFIQGYDRFMKKLTKAKRVRISFTVYKQGDPVLDFDVSGFAPEKYKPK